MGLDVSLYKFENTDTDAILELWQFSEFSTELRGQDSIAAKARELGFPEKIISMPGFGGSPISFPSAKHPEWPVGEWYSFSTVRELMEYFTGKDFYFVIPEARGIHGLFRPDWGFSGKQLMEILSKLRKLTREQIDDFHTRFVVAQISPILLERWKSLPRATSVQIFESCLAQMEVMIETLDFVLNSGNPREFLLYWSN